jgi:hypothetical protein
MYDYASAREAAGTPIQYSDIITIRIKRVASQHFSSIVMVIVRVLFSGNMSLPFSSAN